MKNLALLLSTLLLALGLTACKSGGAQPDKDGPASAPAAGTTTATTADHGHDHDEAGHHGHADDADAAAVPVAFDAPPPVGTKAKCPVSGEIFVVEEDTDRAEYEGKHYVFCCSNCSGKFEADPAKFAAK